MFDEENPPGSYKNFKRSVLKTVEYSDSGEEQSFPAALFVVNRKKEGKIYYVEDVIEDAEENLGHDVDLDFIVKIVLPSYVKAFSSKYFSLVFGGQKYSGNDVEKVVVALIGSTYSMEILVGEIYEDEDGLEISAWEKEDLEEYDDLTTNFRKAITLQG